MSTTNPSASTGHGRSDGGALHIRWVFPSARATPLGDQSTVGRGEECDTVLPGSEISRRHAEFRTADGVVTVQDLGSRNGVFVSGNRCIVAPLRPGDVVRCGEWVVVVSFDADLSGIREIA